MGGIGIDVPSVLGCDGGRGEGTNGSLSCGNELVLDVQNGEDLLCFGIIGHAESVDQVDAQNVLIQVFADLEGTQGLSILVGGRKGIGPSIGPVEFEVIVAGPNDICLMIGSLGMREVLLEGLQGQTGSSCPCIV